MLNKFKSAVSNAISGVPPLHETRTIGSKVSSQDHRDAKFPYNRPDFLHLNWDEIEVSADHTTRPILVPRDVNNIPWKAGYAETINGGKSKWNEDQSRAGTFFVRGVDCNSNQPSLLADYCSEELDMMNKDPLPFTYFAIFDGHAGTGAALMAVNMLHNFIQTRLQDVRDILLVKRYSIQESPEGGSEGADNGLLTGYIIKQRTASRRSEISADELVKGALESAFVDMDAVIHKESAQYKITGGCTALVAVFFMGKLYLANAGDCRAVVLRGDEVIPLSTDFTPETDRQRVQHLAKLQPHLLYGEFTRLQFEHRPTRKDLGDHLLYRDAHMTGWSYKTVTEEDLRIPLIYGEGKRARVLATIGVTRGFGDHDLTVLDTDIAIKPFLTAQPEVSVYDLSEYQHMDEDVLVLGSDGLWDVLPNRKALQLVRHSLQLLRPDDPMRYTSAAQDLVINARGMLHKGWRTQDDLPASYDDISCFVIPLHCYGGSITESSSTESSLEIS